MQFNSISFLFYFLPGFLATYYLCPERWRNAVLCLGSLLFLLLGTASPLQVLWLILLTFFAFLWGNFSERRGRATANVGATLLGCILAAVKCYRGGTCLPVGMGFYVLQLMAYLWKVGNGAMPAERSFVRLGGFTWMFPKLLSGPLADPVELQRQIWGRGYWGSGFVAGLEKLIIGLAMKVLLADRLAGLWNQVGVLGYESVSVPLAWLALVAYGLRIYFDFYGYSLMAEGLARMLGFSLPQNFREPYASKTISDFYRRWHCSLGSWFRTYVYIPLGGSRRGIGRTIRNLAAVWLLTGLWHGGTVNYLLWAGWLFLLIALEKLLTGKFLMRSNVVGHLYVIFAVLLSWVPFATSNPDQAGRYLGRLFGLAGKTLNPLDVWIYGKPYALLLIAGAFLATPLPRKIWRYLREKRVSILLLLLLFWLAVYGMATSGQNWFLYFQY